MTWQLALLGVGGWVTLSFVLALVVGRVMRRVAAADRPEVRSDRE